MLLHKGCRCQTTSLAAPYTIATMLSYTSLHLTVSCSFLIILGSETSSRQLKSRGLLPSRNPGSVLQKWVKFADRFQGGRTLIVDLLRSCKLTQRPSLGNKYQHSTVIRYACVTFRCGIFQILKRTGLPIEFLSPPPKTVKYYTHRQATSNA